ncbi:hypothetical protein SERLA73DRAFT_180078 [Serpula lacrymans var. lacrymans S7.3]|uniref:Alpha/beta hydrolase fold-3 domain-containing protein n=2 Tax=Serpula lacrymans var. lacrymans TaxID=341189 RepID=F8PVM3_SERL3|nr:uncharacterized protein SERLADRAFT_465521 [Serpula lacrymans var. lacrymans S7.9]EGN99840.1 hypothetical protein SERLA73DRAFT_180078 [Serpula lacrymans var. lacrymans S7.3]EGO25409.1 hypothetical protein SERLADRAFT_465521 [Serpula lacrymans var. lacrymans S7.9]
MVYEYKDQPLKGLFYTYQILTTAFVRLPFISLWYIPRSLRPKPSWSWQQSFGVNLFRHLAYVSFTAGRIRLVPDWRAIVPAEGVHGIWIEGVPELVTGELQTWAEVSQVEPSRIPGYWYSKQGADIPANETPVPGEKVFYWFHGGGYVQLSAHPKNFNSNVVTSLLELSKTVQRAFALEYRLASTAPFPDQNPFPAALLDALAGYNHLVNVVGFDPSDIIILGDSAGGNLALALTRYLIENKDSPVKLPAPPHSMILLSPWVDLSPSHNHLGSSTLHNNVDYLRRQDSGASLYSIEAFVRPYGLGAALMNRYISPASLHPSCCAHFVGFPRTFIAVGTEERFLDPVRTLKKKMTADMGEGKGEGQVTYYEALDAVHDYLTLKWHDSGREGTLKALADWLP